MGLKPDPSLSLDRIDNNGNYEPKNCRWTTTKIQNINQSLDKRNKTGYQGIYKHQNGKYQATYCNKSLGYFINIMGAIDARNVAELNDPTGRYSQ